MLKLNKPKTSIISKQSQIKDNPKVKLNSLKCCNSQFYRQILKYIQHSISSKQISYSSLLGIKEINQILNNPDKLRQGVFLKRNINFQDEQIYSQDKQWLLQIKLNAKKCKQRVYAMAQYYKFYNTSPILFQKGIDKIMNEYKYRKKILVYKNFFDDSIVVKNSSVKDFIEGNDINNGIGGQLKLLEFLDDSSFHYYNSQEQFAKSQQEFFRKQILIQKNMLQMRKRIITQNDQSGLLAKFNQHLSIFIKNFELKFKKEINIGKICFKQGKAQKNNKQINMSIINNLSEIRPLVFDHYHYNEENKKKHNKKVNVKNYSNNQKSVKKNNCKSMKDLNSNEDCYGLIDYKKKTIKGKIIKKNQKQSDKKLLKNKKKLQKFDTEYYAATKSHSQKKAHNRCGSQGLIRDQSTLKRSHKYTSSCLSKY